MRTGFAEAKSGFVKSWRWRGRRYFGGLVHGLALGLCLGMLIAFQFDLKINWNPLYTLGLLLVTTISGTVGNAIVGRPPREESAATEVAGKPEA